MDLTQWGWNFQWVWNVEKNIGNYSENFLRICTTVSRKTYINIEDKSKRSQFSYTGIVVVITMKLLEVVTQPYIYHIVAYWFFLMK